MNGLENLKKLRKLYLAKNKIQVLEGLLENRHLEVNNHIMKVLKAGLSKLKKVFGV